MAIDQSTSLADLITDSDSESDYQSSAADPIEDPDKLVVENRWGRFVFDRRHAITMPRGLPGFPDERIFALANLADERLAEFKLLQCLEDANLSFLVAPLNMEASLLQPDDIGAALEEHSIAPDHAAMLLIITVRQDPVEGVLITANMRAPLVIDTVAQIGVQHIFNNDEYPIRFPLNLAA